jgi:hypothetical protein
MRRNAGCRSIARVTHQAIITDGDGADAPDACFAAARAVRIAP